MKTSVVAAALAAAFLAMPAAVGAQMTGEHTAAAAEQVTLQQWSDRIEQALDKTLHYPTLAGGQSFATGTAVVKFNCSDSGRPDKVSLLKSSGSGALDRAALAGIRRIVSLHPLPAGMRHDQQYRALIMFASDENQYRQQLAQMHRDATKSNAWFKGSQTTAMRIAPIETAAR